MGFGKVFMWIFILVTLFLFTIFVIIPSHNSYLAVCKEDKFKEKQEENPYLQVAGQTTYDPNTKTTTIEVFQNDSTTNEEGDIEIIPNKKTLKHELIHQKQYERKFYFKPYCGVLSFTTYLYEIEAYTGQYFPDKMFEFIYGEIGL